MREEQGDEEGSAAVGHWGRGMLRIIAQGEVFIHQLQVLRG